MWFLFLSYYLMSSFSLLAYLNNLNPVSSPMWSASPSSPRLSSSRGLSFLVAMSIPIWSRATAFAPTIHRDRASHGADAAQRRMPSDCRTPSRIRSRSIRCQRDERWQEKKDIEIKETQMRHARGWGEGINIDIDEQQCIRDATTKWFNIALMLCIHYDYDDIHMIWWIVIEQTIDWCHKYYEHRQIVAACIEPRFAWCLWIIIY